MGMFIMRREKLISMIADNVSHNRCQFVRDMIQSNIASSGSLGMLSRAFPRRSVQLRHISRQIWLCSAGRFGKSSIIRRTRFIRRYTTICPPATVWAQVRNSMVADGCVIEGKRRTVFLFRGVHIGKGSIVRNCIIMQGSEIGEGCSISYAVIDKDAKVTDGRQLMGYESYPFLLVKDVWCKKSAG